MEAELAGLRAAQLFREPDSFGVSDEGTSDRWLDAASNDYLGLAGAPVSRETLDACATLPLGAGAARLVRGTHSAHLELEAALATWVGAEAGLLHPTAFSANAGALAALAPAGALVVSDALNHASIVDGCRLSRARVMITPHLDLEAVEEALRTRSANHPAWVVTESYFSMDGDGPDLVALRALCDCYGAGLIVDEAHALGVFGPEGAGAIRAAGIRADCLVGGLGKAVGSQGGFAAGSVALRTLLWNRSRSFVFTTGVSPLLCALTHARLLEVQRADAQRKHLEELSLELRGRLAQVGVDVPRASFGPIVPVVLGSEERALRVTRTLLESGIIATAIRPPTVPPGGSRLRLTVHASWPRSAPERIARALELACAS